MGLEGFSDNSVKVRGKDATLKSLDALENVKEIWNLKKKYIN